MENLIPDYIIRSIDKLRSDICRDTYNLARDDHDAILVQLENLKNFIQEKYEQRKYPSLDE